MRSLRPYAGAFAPQDLQVGAVFAINGKVVGADLFDAPATFRKFMARLVESYAMDAIEDDGKQQAEIATQQVKQFITDMEAAVAERFPPVGEGEDLRLSGNDLAGGALVAEGRVVHLAAFRIDPEVAHEAQSSRTLLRSRRRQNSE